jgi:hypothetical protein
MATVILWRADIDALGHRLLARARSIVLSDMPAVQADMLIAGRVLLVLLRDDLMPDPVEIEGGGR